jgi:hypothetical protein
MEPATNRSPPGPQSGAGFAPLPAQANGETPAQDPVVQSTAAAGEQAKTAAGNPVTLRWVRRTPGSGRATGYRTESRGTFLGASDEGKGGWDVKLSRRTVREQLPLPPEGRRASP